MTGRKPAGVLRPVVAVPATLTCVAALAGLLGAGTEAPCGMVCSEASPDPSVEAWLVAFGYVGLVAALCIGRFLAATDLAPVMPLYRGSLGAFGATSLLLAIATPGAWEPLRPALIVGGLSSLVFLVVAGRLVAAGRDLRQDRQARSG